MVKTNLFKYRAVFVSSMCFVPAADAGSGVVLVLVWLRVGVLWLYLVIRTDRATWCELPAVWFIVPWRTLTLGSGSGSWPKRCLMTRRGSVFAGEVLSLCQ